jgi:RNA polymerase sigma factor (sigma-70 family)
VSTQARFSDSRPAAEAKPGVAAFEEVYRANFAAVSAYFARRCPEPQDVADLVSETFVEAIESFARFDSRRGTPRAWMFGIARHVYARAYAETVKGRRSAGHLAGRRELEDDEIEELAAKIDAQREAQRLMERWRSLPAAEREAIELVDLAGLQPKEAASALGITPASLRVRLFRARTRLRKEQKDG